MNLFLYLPFSSYHRMHVKKGFIKGELIRYVRSCSVEIDFLRARFAFFHRLRARGYPSSFLLPIFDSICYSSRPTLLQKIVRDNADVLAWIVPRNSLTDRLRLRDFLTLHWFNRVPFPVEVAAKREIIWLMRQPAPTLVSRYPHNLRRLLIRADVNAFSVTLVEPHRLPDHPP